MMWFRTVTILLKRYKAGRNWLMNGGLLLGMKRQTFATKNNTKMEAKSVHKMPNADVVYAESLVLSVVTNWSGR